MVLKLNDICINYIAKNFSSIQCFDNGLLNSTHKEILIERIFNLNLLNTETSNNDLYQIKLIQNFFNGHLNLLKFNRSNHLTDYFLTLLALYSKDFSFTSLFINKCQKITDKGLQILFERYSNNLLELKLNNLNIPLSNTFDSIKSFKLTIVDLSFCSLIDDKGLWNLCKSNPYIKDLKLTHCSLISNNGIKQALNMLCKIESLDIEGIKEYGTGFFIDNYTSIPSMNFKSLYRLNFCGSNELKNSNGLKRLFENCPNLKELNILYSNQNQLELDWNQNNLECPLKYLTNSLVSLSLYRPNITDSNELVNAIKNLKHLKQLCLYCVDCLNDKSLIEILDSIGSRLISLGLCGFIALKNGPSDQSIKYLAKYCKNLCKLSFELFSQSASLNSLETLFETKETAIKYEEINLSACRNVSYDLLIQIGLNCRNLKKLDLSGLNNQIDDNLIKIIASKMNKLESLDIKGCTQVTDESICLLALNCPLKYLVLAGISNLTDKCIFAIANHLQFSLCEIYLSGCSRISSVALRYLKDCCINRIYCEHRNPNADPNLLMAKNLDTGFFERVDLI